MDDTPLTEAQISRFRKQYYDHVEFDYWQERLFTAYRRYTMLKKPENKAKYIVEVYSIYIQVIEILLINLHALSARPEHFLIALDIDNKEIRTFAEEIGNNRNFLENFTHNFLYKIRGIKDIHDAEGKIDFDVNLLLECLRDYSDNYTFLNSYKHGFRLHSTHGKNYVAVGTAPDNLVQVLNGDSQLMYYEFARSKGVTSISEVTLTFNHMRIVGKAMFVIYYLRNIRLGILAAYDMPKKVTYPTFYINDHDAWNRDFGQTRFCSELFRIVKKEASSGK